MSVLHTHHVPSLIRKYWPLLLTIVAFVAASWVVNQHLPLLESVFEGHGPVIGLFLFISIGVAITMLPAASTLPLIPLGVALWGWPITAVLILLAWTIGAQLLFLLVRFFRQTRYGHWLEVPQLQSARHLVEQRGLVHAMLLRLVVEGDVLSYAFALFSTINGWRYFGQSLLTTVPTAIIYTYVGSMPLVLQLTAAALVVAMMLVRRYGFALHLHGMGLWRSFKPSLAIA